MTHPEQSSDLRTLSSAQDILDGKQTNSVTHKVCSEGRLPLLLILAEKK